MSNWPEKNQEARAQPRTLVLGLQLPIEIEQVILFLNNFIPSVEYLFLKGAGFFRISCKTEILMDSFN